MAPRSRDSTLTSRRRLGRAIDFSIVLRDPSSLACCACSTILPFRDKRSLLLLLVVGLVVVVLLFVPLSIQDTANNPAALQGTKKMTSYTLFFSVALLLNAVVTFRSSGMWKRCFSTISSAESTVDPKEEARHRSLLRRYLAVYLLATLSDWLQGPYVYALYDAYGYSQHDIAILFVAGFGSSMIFGSFVGGMADWGGRRRFVVLFAITYAASCVTKRES